MITFAEAQPGAGSTKRVLVVAPQPFYEDRGTPIAVLQLIRALTELGHAVDVLTYPIGDSPPIDGVRYFRAANPLRFRSVPIGFSLRKVILDGALLPKLRRRLRERRYDCIHALEEAAFMAVLVGRRHGVPVIYDMQSALPEQLAKEPIFRSRLAQRFLRRCERWLLENVDCVVTSAGLAGRVRAIAPATPVREWSYASELPVASQADGGLRDSLGIAPGAPVVVYTGTFEPYQGLQSLLDAVPHVREHVPDAVFILVGATNGTRTSLGALLRERGVDGCVRVVDRQQRRAMPAYLAMADVLVSPRSYGGNLPLKIFDYLAAGRPIVATDIPTHRAVLDDGMAELVAPTAAGIAAGIRRVLCDAQRAGALAEGSRRYAQANFGWLAFLRSVAELLRLAEAHGRR